MTILQEKGVMRPVRVFESGEMELSGPRPDVRMSGPGRRDVRLSARQGAWAELWPGSVTATADSPAWGSALSPQVLARPRASLRLTAAMRYGTGKCLLPSASDRGFSDKILWLVRIDAAWSCDGQPLTHSTNHSHV
jgi:hypothetical protein